MCTDTGWCERSAASCSVIQRVLERSPQLAFVNGEFRHVYSSVGPSPPPPPLPPPRLFRYTPASPLPPPPPGTPPPFYAVRARLKRPCSPPLSLDTHTPTFQPRPPFARTGRRGLHPAPAPRRLWPRLGRRHRRGRAHGGARELPLCAPRRRGAPARLGLLFARGQPQPTVRIVPLKPQTLDTAHTETVHTLLPHPGPRRRPST